MYIADVKDQKHEYFLHASNLKNNSQIKRIHDEARIKESKKLVIDQREEVLKKNLIAMEKEIDQKMIFMKKSLGLNII